MRRTYFGSAAGAAIFLTAVLLITASSTPAVADSRWGANYFPNVTLTTQDGKQVHFYDDLLKGKIVVIDMIYTHCVDACPLETARLAQVQKMLGDRVGKDIFFYSISIDPSHDTPKVLREYAAKYHAGPGWTFLTGKKEDIDLVSKKLGLYSEPDPSDRDGHTPSVLIGDEPGGQWIRNSATDNPRFLVNMITGWLDNWKSEQSAQNAQNAQAAATKATYDQAPRVDISDKGRYVFGSQCAACHTIGHGDKIGPDLQGVTNVRDHAWLARFIATPDKMVAEKDPIALALYKKYNQVNMPNTRLTKEDVADLMSFLERQSGAQDKDAAGAEKSGTAKAGSGQPMQ
ncbi:MAG TPA: SCO family protein [Candidatus Angelobacter sp.]|jgi:protein SCO1/2|nr:SCO family protein [Candidatus Angelobacter sp.]